MNVTCTMDTSSLNRGIALAGQFTKRTPAEAVNMAGMHVAYNAQKGMPFVTVPKIDSELGTISTPIIGKRGKPLSQKKAKNKTFSGGAMGNNGVPLAALIIMARAKPGSHYNQLTNNRYASARNPFKGFSRELGAFKMKTLIDNMIKARHSSPHFLQAGWSDAIQILKRLVNARFQPGIAGVQKAKGFGDALPATPGTYLATCIIENNIGFEGANAASFQRALIKYGTGPLQDAIDGEGRRNMQYYLDHAGRDLQQQWDAIR